MTRFYAGLAAALVAAFLGVSAYLVLSNRNGDVYAQCRSSQVAGGDIGGPFTLVGTDGKTVTEKEVLAKPALVYFGYTFCPDVCPLDMARNVEAVDILEERGFDVTPVFISIDPERDSPNPWPIMPATCTQSWWRLPDRLIRSRPRRRPTRPISPNSPLMMNFTSSTIAP